MKIAIVGAGIGGLTTAWNLSKAGHEITIYEKSPVTGGIARGIRKDQWRDSVECYYHHWFSGDHALLSLLKEIGIADRVEYRSPKSVMFYQGNFYPFDSIPSAILYPGLGFGINKIRFGFVGIYLKLFSNWRAMEKVTTKEWMTKYAGEKVYQSMWEPMMDGKFGADYADKVNMAWMWARIHSRTTKLGNIQGGMQTVFDKLSSLVTERGTQIRFSTAVDEIRSTENGKLSVRRGNQQEVFDKVLVTTAPDVFAKMVPTLSDDYRNNLQNLTYLGIVEMVIRLKKPLSPKGYYWYSLPKSEGFPFLALVEHTNFIPSERFGGETIIYAGDYLKNDHPYFQMSADELWQIYKDGLKRINPQFEDDWVIGYEKFSDAFAQPVPFINHSQKIPAQQTPIPGLYYSSMSQVYPWDRGMNYAVEAANQISQLIVE